MPAVRRIAITLARACGVLSARAAWTPPDAAQLAALKRALAPHQAQWDPAAQMPHRPFPSPGYHTPPTGGFVRSTRDAFTAAVGLLDPGKTEHLDRACAILRRMIALQDSDPANKTHGIRSWFPRETRAKMSPPDFNWADCNGLAPLPVARDHRSPLPPRSRPRRRRRDPPRPRRQPEAQRRPRPHPHRDHGHLRGARRRQTPFDFSGKLTVGHSGDLRFLDVEFDHRPEREVDLATRGEALTAFALSVGPHSPVAATTDAGRLTLTCDTLTVTAATKPTP